jgi:nicotinate-nucleotide adenylyltransferase
MIAGARVGVLGGTLDPIHNGHLAAADAAVAALGLTDVLVVPSHHPPHRSSDPRASAYDRFAMVALAIDGRPGFRASHLELARDGRSYTATTLTTLARGGLDPLQLFFIIGVDAFAEIATWYEYPVLLDRAHFAVVARPGFPLSVLEARVPDLAPRMRRAPAAAEELCTPRILLVDGQTPDVSSTIIRTRAAAGDSIVDLVPDAVRRYIIRQRLYVETSLHE